MSSKHLNFAFLTLFMGILPIIAMDDQNTPKWLGVPLDEQTSFFNDYDIQKIAETNIDQGILLEQHLADIKDIESYTNTKRNAAIGFILKNNFDKQQKLMGMIKCSSFISSPALEDIINFGLTNKVIPKELIEGSDNTVDSFYKIKNVFDVKPQRTLELVKEVLPKNIEQIKEYSLDENFNPIINDIKTIKYKNDEKKINKINDLMATEILHVPNNQGILMPSIVTNNLKSENINTTNKTIQKLFTTTSLPNKITLILQLDDLNKKVSENIKTVKNLKNANILTLHPILRTIIIVGKALEYYQSIIQPILRIATTKTEDVSQQALSSYFTNVKNAARSDVASFSIRGLSEKLLSSWQVIGITVAWRVCTTPNFTPRDLYDILMEVLYTQLQTLRDNSATAKVIFPQLLLDMYSLYQWYNRSEQYDQELNQINQEQKNIQNLIKEFKESIKKEYKND